MTINAPKKLIPAFDNLKSCLYDIIIMEGGRGGAIQVNTTVMTPEEAYNLLINGGTIKTD